MFLILLVCYETIHVWAGQIPPEKPLDCQCTHSYLLLLLGLADNGGVLDLCDTVWLTLVKVGESMPPPPKSVAATVSRLLCVPLAREEASLLIELWLT